MASGYWSPLAIASADGPTLTAAAAASCLPVTARFTFPPNSMAVGTALHVNAQGRISCVATTPGTARFDIRLGGVVVFDTGPMNLNIVAKTTLPWWFDIRMIVRSVGSATAATIFGFINFQSEAVIASPLGTAGGSGSLLSAVSGGPESAPAAGAGFDSTISNTFDCFFTQTVATGSLTVHNFILESGAVALT